MAALTTLSLFAGIGALDLGLERAGFEVVGQVEIDEYCRRVLARHWPEAPRHDDVRTAPGWWQSTNRPDVDVVAGGFPCQPFSTAGLRRGTGDERWGWPWMAAVIRLVRPRYVLVENVAALLDDRDAFGWLLGDLAELGFDAEWSVFTACSVGAPHVRRRLLLVAYANSQDGAAGLGGERHRARPVPEIHHRTRAWRDRVDRALEASRSDDRETDGLARRMVTAGGNAVVPDVAEHIGHLITAHASRAAA
jgi:DNA (cytosine-5)-methyltransferase 1